jgi:Rieske Fe-S protein
VIHAHASYPVMRVAPRLVFLAGSALAAVALVTAIAFVLTPHAVAPAVEHQVELAQLDQLQDDHPVMVTRSVLLGLEREARRLRHGGWLSPQSLASRAAGLPVWVVRHGALVDAFIALDPRTGCDLEVRTVPQGTYQPSVVAFHDVCHGSLYRLDGQHFGGPSPWTLDRLVVRIERGAVYAEVGQVIPGDWIPRTPKP